MFVIRTPPYRLKRGVIRVHTRESRQLACRPNSRGRTTYARARCVDRVLVRSSERFFIPCAAPSNTTHASHSAAERIVPCTRFIRNLNYSRVCSRRSCRGVCRKITENVHENRTNRQHVRSGHVRFSSLRSERLFTSSETLFRNVVCRDFFEARAKFERR